MGSRQQHSRNGSVAGSSDYNDSHHHAVNGRRHDYDVQAMESDISSRPAVTRNPIPAPTVTIRSEFPTLNRSRQQQSLTCLITVEVPEGSWHPDADDLHSTDQPQDEPYGAMQVSAGQEPKQVPFESQENLDELAEELRNKVDNWHGLEFNR